MSTSNDTVTKSNGTTAGERLIGRVKWFNNKAGYGFVTVTDGAQSGTDIFVHHSAIGVSSQQYRYLVQGEYIEFSIVSTENGKHPFQGSDICGIKGGKLMCETRNELKNARVAYKTAVEEQPVSEPVKMPRQQKAPKSQAKNDEQKDWTLVKNVKSSLSKDSKSSTTEGKSSNAAKGRGRPLKNKN